MALIIDPDNLSQGALTSPTDAVWGTPTGATVTITSAGTGLPALDANMYFEVRDHSDAENNGLYQESGGTPTTGSITADKITGVNPIANAVGEAIRTFGTNATLSTEKSVHFDLDARDIYLLEQGNLSVDGATEQALYSFIQLARKSDDDLIKHPTPMIGITPEQFEFVDDWNPQDVTSPLIRTRKLIRTGGWSEISEVGANLLRQYSGVITLGTFEDAINDLAYFQQGNDPTDTAAAVDFDFAGPVNEAVLVFEETAGPFGTATEGFDVTIDTPSAGIDRLTRNDPGGSFITEGYRVGAQITTRAAESAANSGTFEIVALTATALDLVAVGGGDPLMVNVTDDNTMIIARDFRNAFKPFLRIRDGDANGKTYDSSSLSDIGVAGAAGMDNKVFRFPLSNATDLKIAETDANIDANSPYTQIVIRYFDQAFNREVDSATNRDFGIVIDVGTHSGVDGSAPGAASVLTTAEGGMGVNAFAGGTLRIHEGTDENTTFPIVSNTATTITVTGTIATGTNLSFTAQRSTPVVASAEEIYEKVQRELRRAADIDSTDQVVTGRTADALLRFVGDTLECGQAIPSNPNLGGSGVIIEGFDSNDTNRLTFFDNTGTARTFPFVAAGTITFNANAQNDTGPAEYTMFFEYTERFTNTGFGISGVSGDTATLDSSVTDLVAELLNGDFIRLGGFANPANNGIYVATGAPAGVGPWTITVRKIDGDTLVAEVAGPSVSLDKNPIDSDDAIIVNDNGGSPITGNVPGPSVAFDFDYDNNVQGGRPGGGTVDAVIVIRLQGTDVAAATETPGIITRATGLSFSVVAPLERNFSNP